MKLPRWLTYFLLGLSVAAGAFAAIWWSVLWPNQTVSQFRAFVTDGRYRDANAMLEPSSVLARTANSSRVYFDDYGYIHSVRPEHWSHTRLYTEIELKPLSICDLVSSRRRLAIADFNFEFTAQFGRIFYHRTVPDRDFPDFDPEMINE